MEDNRDISSKDNQKLRSSSASSTSAFEVLMTKAGSRSRLIPSSSDPLNKSKFGKYFKLLPHTLLNLEDNIEEDRTEIVHTDASDTNANSQTSNSSSNKGIGKTQVQCEFKLIDGSTVCGTVLNLQLNSYANLGKHLKRKHGLVIDETVHKKQKETQQSLQEFVSSKEPYANDHPKQKEFDDNVLTMMSLDILPLNFVNGIGFKKCVKNLDPKISIKSRQGYVKRLQNIISLRVSPAIKSNLSKVEPRSCHFSLDIWSTRRREGVLGICAHYINANWEYKSCLIGFRILKERHTAEYIREEFMECLRSLKVPNAWGGYVVTDNASNMIKCFEMTDEYDEDELDEQVSEQQEEDLEVTTDDSDDEEIGDDEDVDDEDISLLNSDEDFGEPAKPEFVDHMGCIAHTLQLGVISALKTDENSKTFISYIKSVMVFFKNSTRWSDDLRTETKLDVVFPAKTRWNATLDMVQRFKQDKFFKAIRNVLDRATVEFRPSKITTVNKKKVPPLAPTMEDLKKAEELYTILRPMGDATDEMHSSSVTANLVVLVTTQAYRRLQNLSVTYFKALQIQLIEQLQNRMNPIIQKSEVLVASILDPRIKLNVFKLSTNSGADGDNGTPQLKVPSLQTATDVISLFFEVEEINYTNAVKKDGPEKSGDQTTNSNVDDAVSSSRDKDKTSLFDVLREVPASTPVEISELQIYLHESNSPASQNPLNYWRDNEWRFPILAKLAKKHLAFPASSAGMERIYSIAGAIARARRARISVKNLANLLLHREFLNVK